MPKKGEVNLPRLRYWKAVLADFEKSGLSGKAYCRKKGIPYTAFANRRRRIPVAAATARRADANAGSDATNGRKSEHYPVDQRGFAEVKIATPVKVAQLPPADRLEVLLPSGVLLRVPDGYSVVGLAAVITALENY